MLKIGPALIASGISTSASIGFNGRSRLRPMSGSGRTATVSDQALAGAHAVLFKTVAKRCREHQHQPPRATCSFVSAASGVAARRP